VGGQLDHAGTWDVKYFLPDKAAKAFKAVKAATSPTDNMYGS
jgi:hypothetical protein